MISSASRITALASFLALVFYLLSSPSHSESSVATTVPASAIRQSIIQRVLAEQHQFVPALDQKLHYVGRWLPTSNRLRWDTAFPGAYLDLVVRNASVIYISLNNPQPTNKLEGANDQDSIRRTSPKTADDREKATTPIALIVTVCNGDLIHFASSENGLIAIHLNARPGQKDCSVRISHAGRSSQDGRVFQFKGLWLPIGASLQPRASREDRRIAESTTAPDSYSERPTSYRKTVELLTDSSETVFAGSAACSVNWLAQVATQFDADWVKTPAHDHCLTEACTKTRGISTQDIFFRSGPAGTAFFPRPWSFQQYVPEVLILELGHVDHKSFLQSLAEHAESRDKIGDTHQSLESFTYSFVSAYVAFIQQIRRTAYPLHPSALNRYVLDGDGYMYNSAPSTLPIFVIRPPDGSLEQATLSVVEQMQKEGDKSVFWIDTSGWLSDADYSSENTSHQVQALTAAGNAKVASFMGAHLCHYLAPQPDDCPFLRRDNYVGSVYVPMEAELDKVIEESKIKRLTELFWGNT